MQSEVIIETRNLTKVTAISGASKSPALKALDWRFVGENLRAPRANGRADHYDQAESSGCFPHQWPSPGLRPRANEVTKNERIGYLPEESYLYKFSMPKRRSISMAGCSTCPGGPPSAGRDLIEMVGLQWAKRRQ